MGRIIGKISTLNLEFGFLTGSAGYKSGALATGWDWSLPLAALAEPRFYYNFIIRGEKGKNTTIELYTFFPLNHQKVGPIDYSGKSDPPIPVNV